VTGTAPAALPDAVAAWAQRLAGDLLAAGGTELRAVYLHGSAVLGGWLASRSDVDVLVLAADPGGPAGGEIASRLGAVLAAAGEQCPGRELEASVVSLTAAARPASPWPFLRHVVAGPGQQARVVLPGGRPASAPASAAAGWRHRRGRPDPEPPVAEVVGAPRESDTGPGDPDLVMHYAVCRVAGWAAYGPPAAQFIGEVPRPEVLAYLAAEMSWGLEHGTEAYTVLNACRAMIYLADGSIVSKIAGGETALGRGTGPPDAIARALRQQQGTEPDQRPSPTAAAFVQAVAAALEGAAQDR
jgi:hypothetical protein